MQERNASAAERASLEREREALLQTRRRPLDERVGVPDAPFKKEWPLLAMKRAIRYAAEHGYDHVTWTTGDQQTERYNLSRHISRLEARKNDDGTFEVEGFRLGGARVVHRQSIAEHALDGVVGKDLAQKIVAGEGEPTGSHNAWREFRGVDLKVGGEGMRAFYDRMLPNEVGKYVKQWGAKIGKRRIDTSFPGRAQMRFALYERSGAGEAVEFFRTREEADRSLRTFGPRADQYYKVGPYTAPLPGAETIEVHGFDVTPAMRRSALEGQPMFARRSKEGSDPSREPQSSIDNIEKVLSAPDPGGTLAKAKAWVRGKAEDLRPFALGALQTRHLLELMEDVAPLKGASEMYGRLMGQLDADRTQLMTGSADAKDHP
ncbi:MAG: hypothetical protein ACREPJ_09060, partial [Rhodanobacteraceae bacterium]